MPGRNSQIVVTLFLLFFFKKKTCVFLLVSSSSLFPQGLHLLRSPVHRPALQYPQFTDLLCNIPSSLGKALIKVTLLHHPTFLTIYRGNSGKNSWLNWIFHYLRNLKTGTRACRSWDHCGLFMPTMRTRELNLSYLLFMSLEQPSAAFPSHEVFK